MSAVTGKQSAPESGRRGYQAGGVKDQFSQREIGYSHLLAPVDIAVCLATLYLLISLQALEFGPAYRGLAILSFLLTTIVYGNLGLYKKPLGSVEIVSRLAQGWGTVIALLMFVAFVTKTSQLYSRQIILSWIVVTFTLQVAVHFFTLLLRKKYYSDEMSKEPVILVGASDLGRYIAESFTADPWGAQKIVGVFDADAEVLAAWSVEGIPPLGSFEDIGPFITANKVTRVYIALPLTHSAKIERLYIDLLATNIDISWVPDIFNMTLINPTIREIAGVPVLALSETPLLGARALTKTIMDKFFALLALVIASPIMVATAIAIRLDSPGPVLFRQKRHGWNGEEIEVWKFRSMAITQELDPEVKQATRNDPRVTRIGRFIRRTSIDELPQLINVLQGRMSMVGPRPHAVEHNNYYSELIHIYFARHKIKPGITGLAQVSGNRGETETIEKMERRVERDLEYINNWSVTLDLKIMFQTLFVLFSKNAY